MAMYLRTLTAAFVSLLVSTASHAALCGHPEAESKMSYDKNGQGLKFKESSKEEVCHGRMDYCPEGVTRRSANDSATSEGDTPELERQIRPRAEKPGAKARNPLPRSSNE